MVEIKFNCLGCGASLRIGNPDLAGKKIKCPKCAAINIIPMSSSKSAAAPTGTTTSKPASKEPGTTSALRGQSETRISSSEGDQIGPGGQEQGAADRPGGV